MQDRTKWYNESVVNVNIPSFSELELRYNGGLEPTGFLTLENMKAALATYSGEVWIKVNDTMTKTLEDEYAKHEMFD
jgi:hypothetical protein